MALPVGYLGVLLVFQHLWDIAAVALLLAIAAGTGAAVLRPGGDEALDLLEETAVGLGVLAVLLLGLGALGLLRPLPIGLLLAATAIAARVPLGRLRARLRRAGAGVLPGAAPGRLALAAAGIAAAFVLMLAVAPPVDWDALMYHLDVPAEWLAAGRILVPVDNLHAAYAGVVHLLYVPLLAFASPAAPAVFGAAMAILLGITMAAGVARATDRVTGALAAALLAGTGMVLLGAITARVDVPLAWFTTLGLVGVLRALDGDAGRRLVRAALVLGIAGGIKYHGIAWAAAMTPLLGWATWRAVPRERRWRVAGWIGVALAVPLVPWLAKNLVLLGAPLYPFGGGPRLDPWLAGLLGPDAARDPALFGALREVRDAFAPWHAFVAPERVSVEWEARYYHLTPVVLLLPLWLARRDRVVALLAAPALLYGAVALVPSTATNLRYFLPMVPPLTMAAVILVARWAPRPLVMGLVLAAGLLPGARVMAVWTRHTLAAPLALGLVSEELYVDLHHDPGVRQLGPAVRLVRNRVPPEGRVLLLYEARGFAFPRPALQDNRVVTWAALAPRTGAGCLADAGFTHVLVNTGARWWYASRGLGEERMMAGAFADWSARCLVPLGGTPGFRLYGLTTGVAPAGTD